MLLPHHYINNSSLLSVFRVKVLADKPGLALGTRLCPHHIEIPHIPSLEEAPGCTSGAMG